MSIRVLIVDDVQLTRLNLKTAIQTTPLPIEWVGEASNGKQAVELAESLAPDVILMDIGMPVLDGIQATRKVQMVCPQAKIVMLTSHESDAEVLDAFRSGATSYCLKETTPEALMRIIVSTHEGEAWIDPKIAKVVLKALHPAMSSRSAAGDMQYPELTEREQEVLQLITHGLSNQEIAEKLTISLNTVKTHLKNIFQKLEVDDRTTAAMKAMKENLL